MSVIGFNFTRISGDRKTGQIGGKLAVKHGTRLVDVKIVPVGSQSALKCSFQHSTTYEPGYAKLLIDGDLIVLAKEDQAKNALEQYTKTRRLPAAMSQEVYNTILTRVGVQALIMSRDLNLPPPFKLPQLKIEQIEGSEGTPAEKKPAKRK